MIVQAYRILKSSALDEPINDVVVVEKPVDEEKLYERSVFRNWDEALNTISIYARQEGLN